MYLIHMRPEQVQDAVARNVPILMPAGCVEYHGPHLPIGTDFLIANSICAEAEKRVECVMAPPLQFAPTLDWAAGPEEGEADFEPEAFFQYARESLRRIAAMGFRRIYILQHHQGPDGLEVLCLKRAAGEVIRETVKEWGAGWGRGPSDELPNPNIFGWIRIVLGVPRADGGTRAGGARRQGRDAADHGIAAGDGADGGARDAGQAAELARGCRPGRREGRAPVAGVLHRGVGEGARTGDRAGDCQLMPHQRHSLRRD